MIEEGQKKKKRQINDREKEKNRERRYLITRIKRKHSDRLSSFFFWSPNLFSQHSHVEKVERKEKNEREKKTNNICFVLFVMRQLIFSQVFVIIG